MQTSKQLQFGQRFLALTIIVVLIGVSMSSAVANSPDLIATTIPAAACQPRFTHPDQAERAIFANGIWSFRSDQTGTITLYCPLPLNAHGDDQGEQNIMTGYRVYYRDGGVGRTSRVSVLLVFLNRDGNLSSASHWWRSNPEQVSDDSDPEEDILSPEAAVAANAFRVEQVNNEHDLRSHALYSFIVRLQRVNPNQIPAFGGIDFLQTPVP